MMYLINFFESLISVWAISELCDIENKRSFIILTTFLSFVACCVCDYFNMVSWPLLISYISIWFIMASIYTKKSYLFNFFVSVVCNYIINLSLILPLILIYHSNAILASVVAKLIHFFISILFVQYRKKYAHIDNKYWILVLLILLCCMITMEEHCYSFFLGKMTLSSGIVIVMMIIVAALALVFFHVIERFAEEKRSIERKLEREKYRNLTYDMIRYAKRELDYLNHGLSHRVMLIKNCLDRGDYVNAKKIVKTYFDDIGKYSRVITTGNEHFDVFLTIDTHDLKYDLVKNINIPVKEFYNSIDFINLITGLLKQVEEDSVVHFLMEDKGIYCLITLSSSKRFFDKEKIEKFLEKYKSDYSSYIIEENENINLLKINVRIKDEKSL